MTISQDRLWRLGLLSVAVNVALALIKIIVGIVGHSTALIADGIESGSDILVSLITWTGFHLSLRPADENHPYGHGKIESLAGVFSGLSVLGAAGFIAFVSIQEIRNPSEAPLWFTLPVLIGVVLLKHFLFRRIQSEGKKVESGALRGEAWHHLSDAITSGAAAIGISIALIGGDDYRVADDWAALAACVIIIINGFLIIRSPFHDLLDGTVSTKSQKTIVRRASSVKGVDNVEKCRVRKSGIQWFVELHVRVDPEMSVFEGHQIAHEVKDHLMAANTRIGDVLVHIEPSAHPGGDG